MTSVFVGNSYHSVTGSSTWFIDLIKQHTELVLFWDDGWCAGKRVSVDEIASNYDQIFVWQVEDIAQSLAKLVPEKVVFVPMWDSCMGLGHGFWQLFGQTTILSFCWALHQRLRGWGLNSFHAQYFPDPTKFTQVTDFNHLCGYLWQRRKEVGWPEVRKLSADYPWTKFWLHAGMDPTYGVFDPPSISDMESFNIEISRFSLDPLAAHENVNAANIYFAPRLAEGIGMSFLEAMARGQCVVAPDVPTMSEYITSGVTGLLYDPVHPRPQDLTRSREIGKAARRHIEAGYEDWLFDVKERLPALLFSEGSGIYVPRTRAQAEWRRPGLQIPAGKSAASGAREGGARRGDWVFGKPTVTVAVVTYNASKVFDGTFRSIEEQSYPNIEIVVVDGGSSDNTPDLIRERDARISLWVSEKDEGPYEAMNKAARLGTGEFIIFMNAGDQFCTRESVRRAMAALPVGTDFVIGHHVFINVRMFEEFHRTSEFGETWQAITSGEFNFQWLSGVPCHQATFTRRAMLLEEGGYSPDFKIAADHEFIYRMRAKGAKFYHCGETLAIYAGGGFSHRRNVECVRDWWRLARLYGPASKADSFFRANYPARCEIRPWTLAAIGSVVRRAFVRFSASLRKANSPQRRRD